MKAKRMFLVLLLLMAFAMATQAVAAYATEGISVTINGERVVFENQQPVLVDGRTLVPVRGVFEALGFEVHWHSATQTVGLIRSDFQVAIAVGNDVFTTNGITHTLDVPAQIIGGSTMLPIRAVLESVGYYLDWHGATQTVLIGSVPFETIATHPIGNIPDYITIRGEQFSTSFISLNLDGWDERFHDLTNEDIEPLRYMTNLISLHLSYNQISDLTPLAGLTNLGRLSLWDNQISDLTPLAGLTNLTRLYIMNNPISDLTPLAGLTNLNYLILDGNQISDLSPLAGLTNLNYLNLGNNQISDLTPLAGLINLPELSLAGNQISNLSPLAGLTNLIFLHLNHNQISDLTPLAGLTNLNSLGLGINQISDLTPLAGLTNLGWLGLANGLFGDLGNNQISDLTPLAGLTNLSTLSISGNPIADWSPVSHVPNVDSRPSQ